MSGRALAQARRKRDWVVRFSVSQRLQHIAIMATFIVLVVTGMPQKYSEAGWSQAIINLLGGIDLTRFIHRASGVLFIVVCLYHLGEVGYQALARRQPLTMVPTLKDARDVLAMMKYSLGLSQQLPQFGRYDYRQKFEYWGLWFGGVAMILSGLILLFPIWFTRLMPGQVVPAAKVLHSNEALLALLTITIWHLYSAHLSPHVFPFDTSIFTGRISRRRQEEEHPLEHSRSEADNIPESSASPLPPQES